MLCDTDDPMCIVDPSPFPEMGRGCHPEPVADLLRSNARSDRRIGARDRTDGWPIAEPGTHRNPNANAHSHSNLHIDAHGDADGDLHAPRNFDYYIHPNGYRHRYADGHSQPREAAAHHCPHPRAGARAAVG
jgi:hypothetical protein